MKYRFSIKSPSWFHVQEQWRTRFRRSDAGSHDRQFRSLAFVLTRLYCYNRAYVVMSGGMDMQIEWIQIRSRTVEIVKQKKQINQCTRLLSVHKFRRCEQMGGVQCAMLFFNVPRVQYCCARVPDHNHDSILLPRESKPRDKFVRDECRVESRRVRST